LKSGDAEQSWAPIEGWWYYRYDITQALDVSLVSIAPTPQPDQQLLLGPVSAGTTVVVSFVATPHGGTLQIQSPDGKHSYDTNSKHTLLRSVAIHLTHRGRLAIRNVNGEQGLRRVLAIPDAQWASAKRTFLTYLHNASEVSLQLSGYATARDADHLPQETVSVLQSRKNLQRSSEFLSSGQSPPRVPPITHVQVGDRGNTYRGVLPADTSVLVLRTTYSNGWALRIAGGGPADHVAGDFFTNAWQIAPSRVPRQFTIQYVPGLRVAAAHRLSAIILSVLMVAALLMLAFGAFRRSRLRAV
jgi:hypothetical protein